jgi:type IV pilus assembly protein PilN
MVRINLLPVKVSKKKEAGKQQVILFAVLVAGCIILNYVWASQRAGVLKDVRGQLERKKTEIQQLERIIGEVKNIRTQQEQLKQKLDVLDKLKAGRIGPVRMLDELATLTPKRLWVRKMEEKAGNLTFEGTAATIDDVSAFMTGLKASSHFQRTELKKTTAIGGGRPGAVRLVEFTITSAVTYGSAPAAAASGPTAAGASGQAGGATPSPGAAPAGAR